MSVKNLLLIIFLFTLTTVSQAQFRGTQNKFIGVDLYGGFILKHKPEIAHLITRHPTGFRITYDRKTFGERSWQQRFNFPDIGLTFIYMDYKNDLLGKSIALIPHYNIYLRKNRGSKNQFSYKIGLGVEYNTEKYDPEYNNKNNLLSTDINFGVILQAAYHRQLGKRTFVNTSISLTHFSNGSLKKPNSGINIISSNLGVSYIINYQPESYILTEAKEPEKTIGYTATLSGGIHAYANRGTGQLPFFIFTGTIDKRLNYKSAVGVALEWFGSFSMKKDIQYDWRLIDNKNKPDWMRVGIALSHELFINKLSVITQVGYYLHDEYNYFGKTYLRIGLRRYMNKNMYSSFSLKSHGARAEAIEFALGWRFK